MRVARVRVLAHLANQRTDESRDLADNQWEADDVIASLIAAHPAREHLIMSTDKDFYQLLSDRVSVLNTQRRADQRCIHSAERPPPRRGLSASS